MKSRINAYTEVKKKISSGMIIIMSSQRDKDIYPFYLIYGKYLNVFDNQV